MTLSQTLPADVEAILTAELHGRATLAPEA